MLLDPLLLKGRSLTPGETREVRVGEGDENACSSESCRRVAKVEPLNETEEAFWRALMRIVLSLPRRLDSDLVRTVGITANEYTTLMCLSEAQGA